MNEPLRIIGSGLAGCTLAWQAYFSERELILEEDDSEAASSLVAAGMLAPITGKGLNPSWEIEKFYDSAMQFYVRVEETLKTQVWHSYPVVRLFFDDKDRAKFLKKCDQNPEIKKWVADVVGEVPNTKAQSGAVIWKGSGRLDVRTFVEASRAFFSDQGLMQKQDGHAYTIHSKGARGLAANDPIQLPHRCAKGEILTVRIPSLREDQIVSRGTWIVPTGKGDQTFLVGANYEWDDLTRVRPIIRKSIPVIGKVREKSYVMNGLGSKGVLYAPLTSQYLLDHICEGTEIPRELSIEFL